MTTRSAPVHARWVRMTHWVAAASVAALAYSGVEILMVHPRLYWGEVGNDLTAPLLELPISRNHRHGGWTRPTPLGIDSTVSAGRTFEIFNQNGWAKLALPGGVGAGGRGPRLRAGGSRRRTLPSSFPRRARGALDRGSVARPAGASARLRAVADGRPRLRAVATHQLRRRGFSGGAAPGPTGLTMSPAVAAAAPVLLDLFGGHQSARTLHFAAFGMLMLFFVAHVVMVIRSGLGRQVRAMTVGDRT